MIRIAVIDGQGGGIGTTIIKRIKEVFGERTEAMGAGNKRNCHSANDESRGEQGRDG